MLGEDAEEENCEPEWVVVKMVVVGLHEREEETDVATSAISEAHKNLFSALSRARERPKRSACVLLEEEETHSLLFVATGIRTRNRYEIPKCVYHRAVHIVGQLFRNCLDFAKKRNSKNLSDFWRFSIAKSEGKIKMKIPDFYICFSLCSQKCRRMIKVLCLLHIWFIARFG